MHSLYAVGYMSKTQAVRIYSRDGIPMLTLQNLYVIGGPRQSGTGCIPGLLWAHTGSVKGHSHTPVYFQTRRLRVHPTMPTPRSQGSSACPRVLVRGHTPTLTHRRWCQQPRPSASGQSNRPLILCRGQRWPTGLSTRAPTVSIQAAR
jgi:hypothetical protein